MDTRVDEISANIYRISTYYPDVAAPAGLTFNQFLVMADEPLLFHCGMRSDFAGVRDAVAYVLPPERLRWISFGHVEADETGALDAWLATATHARVVFNNLGCQVSVNDMANGRVVPKADGEVLNLGGKQVRILHTPHVPHNWEAQVLYEETDDTLLCGDIFTHVGNPRALVETDLVEQAVDSEDAFGATGLGPHTLTSLRRLADLEPATLAVMHGSSYQGDGGAQLRGLAARFEERLTTEFATLTTGESR